MTIAGWMVGRWGRSPPHHLPHGWVTEWMTRIVTQYIASNVWRRVTTPLPPLFAAPSCSATQFLVSPSIGTENGKSCRRTLQWQYITLPGSHRRPAHLRGRLGKRVCVYWWGVAKRLCPPPANLTHLVTRKVRARADSAPKSAERRVSPQNAN